jgi:hypothetical protein
MKRAAALVALAVAAASPAAAQDAFPQTLRWGTGLIDIPVAFVSPLSGDFGLTLSGTTYSTSPVLPRYSESLSKQGAFDVALLGRLELGVSAYSTDPEEGFFWQALLLNQADFHHGLWSLLPSIAVGMRNIGPYDHIDRFGRGYAESPVAGATAPHLAADSIHDGFETANTVYGVATKSVSIGSPEPGWTSVGLSLSVGYGDGLFTNHGTIPVQDYASARTGGIFFGVNADLHPGINTVVTLMAENDAWENNVGAAVTFRGLRAELALTDVTGGSAKPVAANPATALYNYTKVNFSLGWQGNLLGLLHGSLLEDRVARLRAEHKRLEAEIARRETRIAELQSEIADYEAHGIGDLESRRAQIEDELRAEEAELQRLNDEVRRIEQRSGGGGGGGETHP